jgi:hypothetical protein
MKISRKQIGFLVAGMVFGSVQTFGICYGWYRATQASSPRALVDYLQGGEVTVSYKNGQPFQLTLKPPEIKPEKNGKGK